MVEPSVKVLEPKVIFFAVTAPLETVKFAFAKEAIPLFEVVASSPDIVTVLSVTAVSIPSPAAKVSICPVLKESVLDPSDNVKLDVTVANSKSPFESFL